MLQERTPVSLKYFFLLMGISSFSFVSNFATASNSQQQSFIHGITFKVDNQYYNFSGSPDGSNGEQDLPGHHWIQTDKKSFVGLHYNTGPFGAPKWWSSDTENAALLWVLEAKVDIWTQANAVKYFSRGFASYVPIINVVTGIAHPRKVAWLKHVSIRNFTFDGSEPLAFSGKIPHTVLKGIDFEIDLNWNIQYPAAAPGTDSLTIIK